MLLSLGTPVAPIWVSYVFLAWLFFAGGLYTWFRRPDNRSGPLLTVVGLLLLVPTLKATDVPALYTIGSLLDVAWGPVGIYLVVSYPKGRASTRPARALVWITAAIVMVHNLAAVWWIDARDFGCPSCPPGVNLLQVSRDASLVWRIGNVATAVLIADLLGSVGLLVHRWRRASSPFRQILWPLYAPMTLFGTGHAIFLAVLIIVSSGATWFAFPSAQPVFFLAGLPIAVMIGLLRQGTRLTRVGDMVVDLDRPADLKASEPMPERVQAALARTLGDPSIELGYWDRDRSCYSTFDGRMLEVPTESATRAAAYLEREGQPLAVILHDPALLEHPEMLERAAAAARLTIENERLQAEIQAQLAEVRGSRARIVAAGDAERKRVERNLHDGAQQRLLTLGLQLRMMKDSLGGDAPPALAELLARAEVEAGAALEELRELAQGVHPSILTDEGLGPAIEFLAERSPVPVDFDVAVDRLPEGVEATAYFVVAEALTNVAKYAHASSASVRIKRRDDVIEVAIEDNGVGGADPKRGSGLLGLQDRVAALDGRIEVKSPSGGGTVVIAELPCG